MPPFDVFHEVHVFESIYKPSKLGILFQLLWFLQLIILPPVEELQTDPDTRARWIDYSAYDAKATWQLAQALRKALMVSSR